jgi:hypothetical protein
MENQLDRPVESTEATQPSEAAVTPEGTATAAPVATAPKPSYVKLAMRNMVRKRGISLKHFALTTIGLLTVLVGLSYLTR